MSQSFTNGNLNTSNNFPSVIIMVHQMDYYLIFRRTDRSNKHMLVVLQEKKKKMKEKLLQRQQMKVVND